MSLSSTVGREKAMWYTIIKQNLGVIPRNIRATDGSTSSNHMSGTKGSEHVKMIIKETDY